MSRYIYRLLRKKWFLINIGIGLILSILFFYFGKAYIYHQPNITMEKIVYDIGERLNNTEQYTLKIYDNTMQVADLKGTESKDGWQIDGKMYDSQFVISYNNNESKIATVFLEDQEYQIPLELMGIITLNSHLKLLQASFEKEKKWEYSDQQITIPLSQEILKKEVNSFFNSSFNYANFPVQVSYILCYDNLEKKPEMLNIILKNNDHQFFQRLEYRFLDAKVK